MDRVVWTIFSPNGKPHACRQCRFEAEAVAKWMQYALRGRDTVYDVDEEKREVRVRYVEPS